LTKDLQKSFAGYDQAQSQITQYNALLETFAPYRPFVKILEKASRLRAASIILFVQPAKKPLVRLSCKEADVVLVSRTKTQNYGYIITLPEYEQSIRAGLPKYCTVLALPQTKALGKEEQKIREKRRAARAAFAQARKMLQKLWLKEGTRLKTWADYLDNETYLDQVAQLSKATETVDVLKGWVECNRMKELREALKPYAAETHLTFEKTAEQSPVTLTNGRWSPFESVTMIYGLPHSKEFDPTILLAPFFIFFYGLCLSDFGYGLMLVLYAHFLRKKYFKHLTEYGRKLLMLNMWCGFSTMIIGIVTGSYFGINLPEISVAPIRHFLLSLRIIDPVGNPMPMLFFSFGLGVLQLYVGLWIKLFLDWKTKGWKEVLLDSAQWVWFCTGLIGLCVIPNGKIVFQIMTYSGMAGLILFQGRHHKNILQRLGTGFLSLYRLSGFVGDILSYSRLFALGLVTAVLGTVINLLAKMTGGIPFAGPMVMVAVLIGGHVFNFFINILGSFVHSARLQYVEYFTKFFEGGGRFFRPLVWKTQHIIVTEKGTK
jgi:V/A-type H+-transporting ATPase subunit I